MWGITFWETLEVVKEKSICVVFEEDYIFYSTRKKEESMWKCNMVI